jgi:hypothetical protein
MKVCPTVSKNWLNLQVKTILFDCFSGDGGIGPKASS